MVDVPPPIEGLVAELAVAEQAGDHEGAYAVRARIADAYPGAEAATCARYKMALHRLFLGRDMVGAAQLLEEAAAAGHAFWSAAAQTSLGLLWARMGRLQRGLLELRKVAYAESPSVHAPIALTFIESLLVDAGQKDEAARARAERVRLLERWVGEEPPRPPAELGHFLHQLGLALRDGGQPARARAAWERALALGPAAMGDAPFADVAQALAALGRSGSPPAP